jgi:hypothetical protein
VGNRHREGCPDPLQPRNDTSPYTPSWSYFWCRCAELFCLITEVCAVTASWGILGI